MCSPAKKKRKIILSFPSPSPEDLTVFTKDILKNADLISTGRFGNVYCANIPKFGKVTVKCLSDTEDIQLLINMMRHTHHTNIVRLLGVLRNDEEAPIGFVAEFMENGSLLDALHHNKMAIAEDMKCSWIYQAGRALDFLHGKCLIHRDVNPEIMLLCNSYKTLRLGGMGCCCYAADPPLEENFGTEYFIAPEIKVLNVKYTNKIDVYSMAISIWEIITRRNTFELEDDLFPDSLLGPPDSSLIGDSSIRSFVEKAWNWEPDQRPTMAEIVTFFEEKEQKFLKLTAKKTVFFSATSDANIFTMDMFKHAEMVGSGTYGNVFKTRTDEFGDVAAKIFKNCVTEQEQREIINMIKHSNHSNIVRFLGIVANDVSSVEIPLGYVMEYMPDKTIHDALYNTDVQIPKMLQHSWISQAGRALLYLHGRGILHRDVKPSNMLLCDSRKVLKMCDMGMSKNFINGELLSVGPAVGTLEYVAPEVLNATRKKDAYSCSADVYSMAISIWEIVTKRKPYKDLLEEVSTYTFGSGVINGTVRPCLEHIDDRETKTFLERAWNSNPEMRPGMKEIVEFFENKAKSAE